MALNFGEIVALVCEDGIDATKNGEAQEWVRNRHAQLWSWANWTFRYATASITFTDDSQVIAAGDMPTDVHGVYALYDFTGVPLRGYRDIRQFFDRYNTLAIPSTDSYPEAYTVLNGQILVGPIGNGSTGLLVYEKQKPSLVNDTDATGLPDGFDIALVAGAKALGYTLSNNPLADSLQQEYMAQIAAIENDWLDETLETGEQHGAYRPGSGWQGW